MVNVTAPANHLSRAHTACAGRVGATVTTIITTTGTTRPVRSVVFA